MFYCSIVLLFYCSIVLLFYCSIVLLVLCFMWSGASDSSALLLSTIAHHIPNEHHTNTNKNTINNDPQLKSDITSGTRGHGAIHSFFSVLPWGISCVFWRFYGFTIARSGISLSRSSSVLRGSDKGKYLTAGIGHYGIQGGGTSILLVYFSLVYEYWLYC